MCACDTCCVEDIYLSITEELKGEEKKKIFFLCLSVVLLHQQQHLGCALVRTWNNLLCQCTDTCHHTTFAQWVLQRMLHCYIERYV